MVNVEILDWNHFDKIKELAPDIFEVKNLIQKHERPIHPIKNSNHWIGGIALNFSFSVLLLEEDQEALSAYFHPGMGPWGRWYWNSEKGFRYGL